MFLVLCCVLDLYHVLVTTITRMYTGNTCYIHENVCSLACILYMYYNIIIKNIARGHRLRVFPLLYFTEL